MMIKNALKWKRFFGPESMKGTNQSGEMLSEQSCVSYSSSGMHVYISL